MKLKKLEDHSVVIVRVLICQGSDVVAHFDAVGEVNQINDRTWVGNHCFSNHLKIKPYEDDVETANRYALKIGD